MTGMPIIARALELAESGSYSRIGDIERKLNAEGYLHVHAHLAGQSVRRQLRARITAARQTHALFQ